MKIPETHQTLMPYLILKNAEAFFDFTAKVFNAKDVGRHYDEDKNLRHGEIMIGGSTVMFGGSLAEWPPQPAGMFVYVENADETYKKALANGATSIQEPDNKDYGRSCGVKDPFGNTWWITSL